MSADKSNPQTALSITAKEATEKKQSKLCSASKSTSSTKKYKTKDVNVSPKGREFDKAGGNNGKAPAETLQLTSLAKNASLQKSPSAASNRKASRACFAACRNVTAEECKQTRKAIKRPIPCLFAWSLLIGTTGCYFAICAPELLIVLNNDLNFWLPAMGTQCFFVLYSVINFIIATLRDPGRFPKYIMADDDPLNDDQKSPLYRTITIKRAQVKIKWCSVSYLFCLDSSVIMIRKFID